MPNIVCGQVNAEGTITGGKGFTVKRTDTGIYSISFTSAFKSPPVVTGSANVTNIHGSSWTVCCVGTENVTATECDMILVNINTNNRLDADFSFIAASVDAGDE